MDVLGAQLAQDTTQFSTIWDTFETKVAVVTFPHFVCTCCSRFYRYSSLLAKIGKATLHPKEGHETNRGCTAR